MLNEEEKIQFLTGKLNPIQKPSLNIVRIFLSTASQQGLFNFFVAKFLQVFNFENSKKTFSTKETIYSSTRANF